MNTGLAKDNSFLDSCIKRYGSKYIMLADASIRWIGVFLISPVCFYYFYLASGIPVETLWQFIYAGFFLVFTVSVPHTMLFTYKSTKQTRAFLEKVKNDEYCPISRQELWDEIINLPAKITVNIYTAYPEVGIPALLYMYIFHKIKLAYAINFAIGVFLTISLMGQPVYFFLWEIAIRPILSLILNSKLLPDKGVNIAKHVYIKTDLARKLKFGVISTVIASLILTGTLGYSSLKSGIDMTAQHLSPDLVFSSFILQMLLIATATVVFVLIFIYLLSRSVSIPLEVLSGGIKRVSKGDLDFQIDILSNDELGVVAQGFNDMIVERKKALTELQKAQQELEIRVEERTAELKAAHEQLLHAEKLSALGKLSASIAHEFNNPLFGIKMVLDELRGDTGLDQDKIKLVELAIREGNRMARLISNLQDFFQPSSDVVASLDVHKIIGEVLEICVKKLMANGVKVLTDFAPDVPNIPGVADQIKQVFLNIINNAEEAMLPSGGSLAIQTKTVGNKVQIIFRDTGHGILKENLPKVFEPFFTTKSAVKGTGLGLSVSYGIIKRHRGNILIDSTPNVGSTFTIELPLA